MPELKMPEPRSWSSLNIVSNKGGKVILYARGATIIFWKNQPIGVEISDIMYFPSSLNGPALRVLYTSTQSSRTTLQRSEPQNFDFMLAQALLICAQPWLRVSVEVPRG